MRCCDLIETRDPATEPSDYRGECDSCHQEAALWIDWNDPGEWAMCAKCWRKAKAKANY